MEMSLAQLEQVNKAWANLRSARPDDLNLAVPNIGDLSYDDIEGIFISWDERLQGLSKTRWMATNEAALVDAALARHLVTLHGHVTQATRHGTVWLLSSSGFTEKAVEIGQLVAVVADRRTGVAKKLANELERRGMEQLGAVVKAAESAAALNDKSEEAEAAHEQILQLHTQTSDKLEEANHSLERLAAIRNQTEETHKVSETRAAEIGAFHSEAVKLRAEAETQSHELHKKIEDLKLQIADGQATVSEANQSLKDSLINVRRQGLAGAFSHRATRIFIERIVWLIVFCISVAYLVKLASEFAIDLNPLTLETLGVALLRRAALAAPLIWLGWYAATQLGRLGRIQEDYAYKAATALAFESYKNEVAANEDNELLQQLLRKTIENFGDNPVRLYEPTAREPASPAEEAVHKLDEAILAKLVRRLLGSSPA